MLGERPCIDSFAAREQIAEVRRLAWALKRCSRQCWLPARGLNRVSGPEWEWPVADQGGRPRRQRIARRVLRRTHRSHACPECDSGARVERMPGGRGRSCVATHIVGCFACCRRLPIAIAHSVAGGIDRVDP